jgi:hypothetical protein
MGSDPVMVVSVPPYWGSPEFVVVVAGDDVVDMVGVLVVVVEVVVLEPLQDASSVTIETIHNSKRATDFILCSQSSLFIMNVSNI